jgi:hypothetical protein
VIQRAITHAAVKGEEERAWLLAGALVPGFGLLIWSSLRKIRNRGAGRA